MRCSQHYSGAPICAPARAALLTGRYHHRCGALSVESNRGLDRIALRERTVVDENGDEDADATFGFVNSFGFCCDYTPESPPGKCASG